MATLDVTRDYADGEILLAADLSAFLDDIETFLNVTKLNDDNLQDGGITGSLKLASGSVSTAKLANSSVTTDKLDTSAVTTAKIADASVTTAKIADANVTTAKIADASVTTAKIEDGAVTAAKTTGIPALASNNTFSGTNTFSSTSTFSGASTFSANVTIGGNAAIDFSMNASTETLITVEGDPVMRAIYTGLGSEELSQLLVGDIINNVFMECSASTLTLQAASNEFTTASISLTSSSMTIRGSGGADLLAESSGQATSEVMRDDTTASSANMVIDASTGRIQRSTSSLRYKKDVETVAEEDAAKLLSMRPVTFRGKQDREDAPKHYGFIAEELANDLPWLVAFIEKDGKEVPDSVAYDRVPALIVAYLQRQADYIQGLEDRISALEAKLK